MKPLFDTLVAELERPRTLPAQVIKHLAGTHGVERDGVEAFLVGEMPGLEDYEIDLILSPVFTPALSDQAVFAELLGQDCLPREQWPALIQRLAARPTCARIDAGGGRHYSLVLREVTIERFVHRLRLEAEIPEALFKLIARLPSAADRPTLLAIARRAVWENDARRDLLAHYLTAATREGSYCLQDASELLRLAEVYQLADRTDLLARIPHWQQTLRHEIQAAGGPKSFFNERVEELHGGGRDQRRQDGSRVAAREKELAVLERLQKVFAT